MKEDEWADFLLGNGPSLRRLCRAPKEIARALDAEGDVVSIHRDYAAKVFTKHQMGLHLLPLIPVVIEFGWAICDRARHVSFFYEDTFLTGRPLKVTIKTDAANRMLFCTYHRMLPEDLNRRLKGGTYLRTPET